MKHRPTFRKKDYPVAEIRRYLEPGLVVLVSSAWKRNTNIMSMGWHMVAVERAISPECSLDLLHQNLKALAILVCY